MPKLSASPHCESSLPRNGVCLNVPPTMNSRSQLSRRSFLARAALLSSSAALLDLSSLNGQCAVAPAAPITVFSKIYQELKLDFEQAAALTADAGLDGIDCPVRPGGEIAPERAVEDMPRYAEALRRRKTDMLLLTTAIQSIATPHAEDILRTAKKLGIRYYRLGQWYHAAGAPEQKLVNEIKAQLKDVAAMNKEIGVCAMFQNHRPGKTKLAGGDLGELYEIVKDFDPTQIGVAFDLGHALVVHGDKWAPYFEKLKSHLSVAYIKDADRAGHFVRFGEGDFGGTDYFTQLKRMNYRAPYSIHIEFDWSSKGKNKTRAALLASLQDSAAKLRQWVAKS